MKDSDNYRDMKEMYNDLPNLIKRYCNERGLDPAKDLNIELDTKQTIYDLSKHPDSKFFKFKTRVVCCECNNEVEGYLILDRKKLNIVDSSGFVILENPTCNKCIGN